MGTLLTTGSLNKPLTRALKAAGISTRLTTHGLRRTVNTLALQVAPGETVRKILGHSTAAMTERYNAPDIEAKRGVLGQVFQLVQSANRAPSGSSSGSEGQTEEGASVNAP